MNNLVLTGFMGTGKTTVGQLVADQLGWQFVDSDDAIVRQVGRTIPEIFAVEGEAGFRHYETQVCAALATGQHQVIATGGGALVNAHNRAVMQANGLVICLTAAPEVIKERLTDFEGRPLAPNWESLLQQRRAAYAEIPYQVDTTHKTPQDVAQEIVDLWQKSSR